MVMQATADQLHAGEEWLRREKISVPPSLYDVDCDLHPQIYSQAAAKAARQEIAALNFEQLEGKRLKEVREIAGKWLPGAAFMTKSEACDRLLWLRDFHLAGDAGYLNRDVTQREDLYTKGLVIERSDLLKQDGEWRDALAKEHGVGQ